MRSRECREEFRGGNAAVGKRNPLLLAQHAAGRGLGGLAVCLDVVAIVAFPLDEGFDGRVKGSRRLPSRGSLGPELRILLL